MAAYHAENGYAFGYGMMGYGCAAFDADDGYSTRGRFGTRGNYYGPGMMRGYDSDYGYYGPGMMRGYNWN